MYNVLFSLDEIWLFRKEHFLMYNVLFSQFSRKIASLELNWKGCYFSSKCSLILWWGHFVPAKALEESWEKFQNNIWNFLHISVPRIVGGPSRNGLGCIFVAWIFLVPKLFSSRAQPGDRICGYVVFYRPSPGNKVGERSWRECIYGQ